MFCVCVCASVDWANEENKFNFNNSNSLQSKLMKQIVFVHCRYNILWF